MNPAPPDSGAMEAAATPQSPMWAGAVDASRPGPVQRVLTVDDDPTVRAWINALLRRLRVEVVEAGSGEEALARAAEGGFDLILLDVNMPGMDGYQVASTLAEQREADDPGVPIIFLTGSDCGEDKLRAFQAGACDYVLKPFEPAELLARVQSVLRTRSLLEQLERQARTDRLTGLLNRSALRVELETCLRRYEADREDPFAVLFLDLDRFKVVNDSLGHAVGDQLLCHVATQIRAAVGESDGDGPACGARGGHAIARNGGDEFVVVLRGMSSAEACRGIAASMIEKLSVPITLGGRRLRVGASVGIRWVDGPCPDFASLLRDADTAMYEAKHAGRGQAIVFEEAMHQDALARLELEEQIRVGIAADEFVVHFQPIICAEHNRLERFEALARWDHPTRGLLNPEDFIPFAEEIGLIVPLGNHILGLACRELGNWVRRFGPDAPGLNVNVASEQLLSPGFSALLTRCAGRHGVPLHKLGVEVTESTLVGNATRAAEVLTELREMGLSLSIDDFGTGYSSLSTLRRFPFNTIKVDRAFVQSMAQDRSSGGVIQAIVGLAWNLNMSVVAEGAETASEIVQLLALEVDFLQGFGISRPVDSAAAGSMIQRRHEPFLDVGPDNTLRPCSLPLPSARLAS